jgi:transposase
LVETLDLGAIYSSYQLTEGGRPPYEPRMMVALVLYAYSVGVYSSRKIELACLESVAFRVLSVDQHPDQANIASFRKRHLKELGLLFNQVLKVCQRAGLVKLGHVALDSTKVKANASRHKAMSYGRMLKSEQQLKEEIAALLKRAQREDEEENARLGPDAKDEQLPEELKRRQTRLAKIREAKAALEAEAQQKAEEEARHKGGGLGGTGGQGRVEAKPTEKAQRNFTDPQSRIMLDKSSNSFVQAYNCQAAVDGKAQVIVAAEVTQETNDSRQLHPMLERLKANTEGALP